MINRRKKNIFIKTNAPNKSRSEPVNEAGAIVIRLTGKKAPEVLLVLSKKKPKVRIFPKGHIEPGESEKAAAARELLEEAGVKGRLICEAGSVSYVYEQKEYRVKYFLFQFETFVTEAEKGRDPRWYTIKKAVEILPFKVLSDVLKEAYSLHPFLQNNREKVDVDIHSRNCYNKLK